MRLEVHATSDVGYVRTHNEDMALVGRRFIRDDRFDGFHEVTPQSSPYVLAVADGLGGQNAGEVASREVLANLKQGILELDAGLSPSSVNHRLGEISEQVHKELVERGNANHRHRGMSTTLTAVIIYEGALHLLHAGDSRCYVQKNGLLRQVTRDHTLREFSGNPSIPGNILVNCFGAQESFFVDTQQFGTEGAPGDMFLVCSDGLSDMVSDGEIEQILSASETVSDAGEQLLEAARQGGGRDNITFVLARVL